jgi:hypothetical protein
LQIVENAAQEMRGFGEARGFLNRRAIASLRLGETAGPMMLQPGSEQFAALAQRGPSAFGLSLQV